jgi:hypothetical protein
MNFYDECTLAVSTSGLYVPVNAVSLGVRRYWRE